MTTYSRSFLYEKYKNDCVSREEFSKLADLGILCRPEEYAFPTTVSVGDGKNTPRFSGETAHILAGKKELLFFENWQTANYKQDTYLHLGCYVYPDFLVIAAEPDYNENTNQFGVNYNVDPVAIPLSKVNSIDICVSTGGQWEPSRSGTHKLRIWIPIPVEFRQGTNFKRSSIFEADLFWENSLWNCLVHDNWSLAVNSILLKTNMGVQINQANRITNQIQSALETIVSRCTDYEKRRDSIYCVFDKSAAQVIEDNLYMPEQDFVKLLVEYQGHLKLDASHTLKEKISYTASVIEENTRTVAKLKEKVNVLDDAISKAEVKKEQAGFFKKGTFKKEIKELTSQKSQLLQKIESANVPESLCSEVMKSFLAPVSPKAGWSETDIVLAQEIYAECQKRNLTEILSDEDQLLVEMVGKQFGIKCIDRAIEMFSYGKEIANRPKPKAKKSDARKELIAFENKYYTEKEQSSIVGWDKYLTGYYEKIAEKQKELAELGSSYNLGINTAANSTSKPVDWAIVGGLAQGIAGPAAGIMAAADTQRRNAQAAATSQKAYTDGIKLAAYSEAFAKKAEGELRSILNEVEKLTKRIYDTDHPQLFFDYLSCEVCRHTIVMKNVMRITVEVACKKESEFNGVPIAIDGSIRVDILEGDQVIANAFICADGFGVTDFNKVGFRGKKKYTVIAMTTGKSNFNKDIKYTFRFSPEHIWIVEK